ncbi:MAG: hypothetical protein ACTSRC_18740 [Candidatus Helarchaeota archaeon]
MPSKYIENLRRKYEADLRKSVEGAVRRGATLSDIESESQACKKAVTKAIEAGLVADDDPEDKVQYYKFCLTKSLKGKSPDEIMREYDERLTELCNTLASQLTSPHLGPSFIQKCKAKRGRSVEEILRINE